MLSPNSLTFPIKTQFNLSWMLIDQAGNPINNASVVANLYQGRSQRDPVTYPGTVVPPIQAFNLPFVSGSAGVYTGLVPATLNPTIDGTGFVLTIDATVSGSPVYHAEQPIAIETTGSVVDLTTVDAMKSWLQLTSTQDDAMLQACITAVGYFFLWRTGNGNTNGQIIGSPLNSVQSYDEWYDGSDNDIIVTRQRPIVTVTSVTIDNNQVVQSGSPGVPGWVVDQEKISVRLRQGSNIPGFGYTAFSGSAGAYGYRALGKGLRFWRGVQNVEIVYTAGYPDVPPDLELATKQVVGQNYKRRDWIDEASRSMAAGAGTQRFRDWVIPIEAEYVLRNYARRGG